MILKINPYNFFFLRTKLGLPTFIYLQLSGVNERMEATCLLLIIIHFQNKLKKLIHRGGVRYTIAAGVGWSRLLIEP